MRKIRLIAEAVCLITSMTITPVVTSVEKNDSMVVETVAEASQTPVLKSANVIPILQSEDTTNSLKLKGLDNDQVNTEIVKEEYYEPDGVHMTSEIYPLWLVNMAEVAGL